MAEHAFASVTVTVYVPAAKLEIVDVLPELLQRYVYGVAPPVAETEAEPVFVPLQFVVVEEQVTLGAEFTVFTIILDSPT